MLRTPERREIYDVNRITKAPGGGPSALKPIPLVEWFEDACNDGPQLIGTEHEKFGVVFDAARGTYVPIDFEHHVRPMFADLVTRHGWAVGKDRGTTGEIVALSRDNASVTLEPGGQLELSGAPFRTIHETCAEFSAHQVELDDVARRHGVTLLACGFHPFATRAEINWMPKGRYRVMREYLPTRGARALDMMTRTATVQANFDYKNEIDCGRRLRLAASLTPALVAMFANSPYRDGRHHGVRSERSAVWEEIDPDRCGLLEVLFDEDFSFEKYAHWALEIPMFFVKRSGRYLPYHGTFSQFIKDGMTLEDGSTTRHTEADWRLHLNTLFPEARLNPFIELRTPDSADEELICALPAFAKGLLYDDDALSEALELTAGRTLEQRREAWRVARNAGLGAPDLLSECRRLLEISQRGLARIAVRDCLAEDETRFMTSLVARVQAGRNPADEALDLLGVAPAPSREPEGVAALVRHYYFAGTPPNED